MPPASGISIRLCSPSLFSGFLSSCITPGLSDALVTFAPHSRCRSSLTLGDSSHSSSQGQQRCSRRHRRVGLDGLPVLPAAAAAVAVTEARVVVVVVHNQNHPVRSRTYLLLYISYYMSYTGNNSSNSNKETALPPPVGGNMQSIQRRQACDDPVAWPTDAPGKPRWMERGPPSLAHARAGPAGPVY